MEVYPGKGSPLPNKRQRAINALHTATDEIGHSPAVPEFHDLDTEISATTIITEFGSWNNAKEAASLEPNPMGSPAPDDHDQKCIETLQQAASTLGYSPSRAEFRNMDTPISESSITNEFGSWNEAKRAADLEMY